MNTNNLLSKLNEEYFDLHKTYEDFFRTSYMGDHSIDEKMNKAEVELNAFKSNSAYAKQIEICLSQEEAEQAEQAEKDSVISETQTRLLQRKNFFKLYQTPEELKPLRKEIITKESEIQKELADTEKNNGYINPNTGVFTKATNSKMNMLMITQEDEEIRKACFIAIEKAAGKSIKKYITLINMRNEFAKKAGYKNFYDYKAQIEEQMSGDEIFKLFDNISDKLKPLHKNIVELEKDIPNIRKPRNFGYLMSGNFVKEEDQYFPIAESIQRRGESFAALNINYKGATMKLDLLERDGKYNNGFCHQPKPNFYNTKENKFEKGQINFTCIAIPGQVGSGSDTSDTLFHEGGHAAHFANMTQKDVILNTEYPPASTARAETHSMFLDTMYSSIERKTRYAKNKEGKAYPFELFEKKVKKLHKISYRNILHIAAVVKFEEIIYTSSEEKITKEFIINTAKQISTEYLNYSEPTLRILEIPHIYSRSSAAYYHGYGMAIIALEQRREYFYEKYGYIVDNHKVGEEMVTVRKEGSNKSPKELLRLATGQDLSPDAYIKNILKTEDEIIEKAKQKIEKLETIPKFTGKIDLDAEIEIVDGKTLIASNKESFEQLCNDFEKFINKKLESSK